MGAQKLDLKAIGRRIRQLRGAVRQENFAADVGVSQGQLSKIERGKLAPTMDVLLTLSNKFAVTLDWIAKGK